LQGVAFSGPKASGLGETPAETRIEVETRELGPGEPPQIIGFLGVLHEGFLSGSLHEIAQVEMIVLRLLSSGRYAVDVHVEWTRSVRVYRQSNEAGLFARLAQCCGFAALLPGISVAAGLQPAVELAMVEEQHAGAVVSDHERARREVSFGDRAVERVRMSGHEGSDVREMAGFDRISGDEAGERISKLHVQC
jgi:hypothetical protein